jgi:hypothetical protein
MALLSFYFLMTDSVYASGSLRHGLFDQDFQQAYERNQKLLSARPSQRKLPTKLPIVWKNLISVIFAISVIPEVWE